MNKLKKFLAVLSVGTMLIGSAAVSSMTADAKENVPFENPDAIINANVEDCGMSYKICMINGTIVDDYNTTGNFKGVFSDEYLIMGQYKDDINGNCLITFKEVNGNWIFSGAMELKEHELVPDLEKEAENIVGSQNDRVLDVMIGKSNTYEMYLVYYKTDKGEFVVPLEDIRYNTVSKRGIWNCVESGKTYTADEFIDQLSKYQSKYEGLLMGDANGDSKVDVRDCSFIVNEIAMLPNYHASGTGHKLTMACDYNKDGNISVRDAADIARDLANK